MSDLFTSEEIEKARALLELFQANNLSELSVTEHDGFSIEITATRLDFAQESPQAVSTSLVSQAGSPPPTSKTTSPVVKQSYKTLNAPMVGIFYTSPSPGDPPYISIGDTVSVGQTIGLIEAMKVFSEIPSELSGRIVELVSATGTLVQQNQPLYNIEPI